MKSLLTYLAAILIAVSLGCSSSRDAGTNSGSNEKITGEDLARYISTIPRLEVRSSQVYNTSSSSFQQGTRPLFILDGVQVGRDFRRVLQLIDSNKALEVEFVKMSRATIRYGEEGRNGLILIKTS